MKKLVIGQVYVCSSQWGYYKITGFEVVEGRPRVLYRGSWRDGTVLNGSTLRAEESWFRECMTPVNMY